MFNLLVIHLNDLHIKGVDSSEHIGGSLHHNLPVLWHGQWCTPGHKHRLIPAAQWQVTVEMSLDKNHFLVTEPHLPPGIS